MADPYIGEIRMAGFNFAPQGWATCDGQLIAIAQNTALFSLLGTTYGGDGRVTFALPDMRGRIPIHEGQGPGLSPYSLGQADGDESVTLTTDQMPAHNHAGGPLSQSAAGTTTAILNSVPAKPAVNARFANMYSSAAIDTTLTNALTVTGGSQPHNNLMPYLSVNFIVATVGVFPPRS